jgi:hypothetical protein
MCWKSALRIMQLVPLCTLCAAHDHQVGGHSKAGKGVRGGKVAAVLYVFCMVLAGMPASGVLPG